MILTCAGLCSNKSSLYRQTGNAYWTGYKSAEVHFTPLLFCLGNWEMHLGAIGSNTERAVTVRCIKMQKRCCIALPGCTPRASEDC